MVLVIVCASTASVVLCVHGVCGMQGSIHVHVHIPLIYMCLPCTALSDGFFVADPAILCVDWDTSKPGPWTLDWTVDWTVDSVRDDHYRSIGTL